MIYQLYRAVDRRDNTEALWLLRAPSGAHQMEEMAYLGKNTEAERYRPSPVAD